MADLLSGKVHKEIEDRFELAALPKETKDAKYVAIKQGILREAKNDDQVVAYARVRSYAEPGKSVKYSLGVKHFPLSQESETTISKEMFDAFYPDNLSKPQEKKRFILDKGWIIDQLKDGKILAERERTESQGESKLPEGWEKMAHVALPKQLKKYAAFPKPIIKKADLLIPNEWEKLEDKQFKEEENISKRYTRDSEELKYRHPKESLTESLSTLGGGAVGATGGVFTANRYGREIVNKSKKGAMFVGEKVLNFTKPFNTYVIEGTGEHYTPWEPPRSPSLKTKEEIIDNILNKVKHKPRVGGRVKLVAGALGGIGGMIAGKVISQNINKHMNPEYRKDLLDFNMKWK